MGLDHPSVVRLLDSLAPDGSKSYLVYERAGLSLARVLRDEFRRDALPPATGFAAEGMRDALVGPS